MSEPKSAHAPPVYALLAQEANLAADAALVEALANLEPERQALAVDTLIARARDRGLAELVGNFADFDDRLQELILARIEGLYAGARLAIADKRFEFRASAIELIRRSGHCKLVYLLADALRSASADQQTRQRAAEALNEVTAEYLGRRAQRVADAAGASALERDGAYLGRALRRAVECWELHFRSEVLLAAAWLGDRLEGALLAKAGSTRSQFARALIESVYGGYDPRDARLAGFALRALQSPELRTEMAKRLAACRHPDFVRRLMDDSWLLADPRIARGFQRVRQLAWLDPDDAWLLDLPPGRARGALRLIGASGLKPEEKAAACSSLLSAGAPALQEAAFWKLIEIETEAANSALRTLAQRGNGRLPVLARRELKRRGCPDAAAAATEGAGGESAGSPQVRAFDELWRSIDQRDEEAQREAAAAYSRHNPDLLPRLDTKLASTEAGDRSKALRIARVLGLGEPLAERVYQLANDPDAVVRSSAAALLGDLGGATARRILGRLLDDPDPRVQANTIEAIDRLEIPERDKQFEAKLEARHHRVRATAVAALLKMQVHRAGEVLLDMLEDPSRSQRIAALWVVERLQLGSLLYRLDHLAQHDPDEQVQRRARRAYRSIGSWLTPPEAVAPLEGEPP
jgi:HEAT repeat protein